MSHIEKDCSKVFDEDGYGWGMDIWASPRKGHNKNREEEFALKARKSLFLLKPKPCANTAPVEGMGGNQTQGGKCYFYWRTR